MWASEVYEATQARLAAGVRSDRGLIVDGVGYTTGQIRRLVLERHELASEVVILKDTLRRRTAALNRVAAENDLLRAEKASKIKKPKPSRRG